MDAMQEIKLTFFQECEDLLQELEVGLAAMEEGENDMETVNAVFRAVHSIKGGAGAFGFDDLVRFAHTFETTLDEVRNETLEASGEVMKIFFQSCDMLADLVNSARDEQSVDMAPAETLIGKLAALIPDGAGEKEIEFEPLAMSLDFDDDDADEGSKEKLYTIRFTPQAALYATANEPLVLIRALNDLGDVEVTCDQSDIALLDELDPEGAYLSWTICLRTEEEKDAITEIFQFVEGMCTLEIESDAGADEDAPALLEAEPITLALEEDETEAKEQPAAKAEPEPAAAEKAAASTDRQPSAGQTTIRVDLDRVDRLVNLVGELVINQAMLTQLIDQSGQTRNDGLDKGLEDLKLLTREIQEGVMAIRAQPVKALFQRMGRIVREASSATEKSVRLVTDGEWTEVDKTVIERLADPLTHMIRNAVDHGLESPETRLANGKPEEGTVTLSAGHRSGRVIITVSDDGAGINREGVKAKAIEKGLIDADAQLTDAEIDNLLFMPGFSTAKEVSNLSGRGVGMDVVKRAIQSVGGKITISSAPGEGSSFFISLPLTLAVMDGMVVQVEGQTLVMPLTSIVESLKPEQSMIHEIGSGGRVVSIRGEFIPLIDLGMRMGYRKQPADLENSVVLSVETEDDMRAAIVVDGIQDQRQVVIKSLEDNFGQVPSVAAATILGDGRIALILDVDDLIAGSGDHKHYRETALAMAS